MDRRLRSQSKIGACLRATTLLPENFPGLNWDCCRAQKRIYVGQGQMGGSWVQCSKKRRPGKRTCHWHRHLEEEENQ